MENKIDIEDLHNRCEKMASDDLILILFQLSMMGKIDKRVFDIMKTYLFRALFREGFR